MKKKEKKRKAQERLFGKKFISEENIAKIEKMLKQGKRQRDIANELDISRAYLTSIISKHLPKYSKKIIDQNNLKKPVNVKRVKSYGEKLIEEARNELKGKVGKKIIIKGKKLTVLKLYKHYFLCKHERGWKEAILYIDYYCKDAEEIADI